MSRIQIPGFCSERATGFIWAFTLMGSSLRDEVATGSRHQLRLQPLMVIKAGRIPAGELPGSIVFFSIVFIVARDRASAVNFQVSSLTIR